jgi:hypothetical protein
MKEKVSSVSPVSSNDMQNRAGLLVKITLEKNIIETGSRKVPLIPLMPLEAVITVDKVSIARYIWKYITRR